MRGEWVTVYVDASFSFKYCHSGFAYWAKGHTISSYDSNTFKVPIKHLKKGPNYSEMKTILIAARIITKRCKNLEGIRFVTDSQVAIDYLKYGSSLHKVRVFTRIRKELELVLKGIKRKMVKVPAHNNLNNASSWANDWCDKNAKKRRKKLEKKINENL